MITAVQPDESLDEVQTQLYKVDLWYDKALPDVAMVRTPGLNDTLNLTTFKWDNLWGSVFTDPDYDILNKMKEVCNIGHCHASIVSPALACMHLFLKMHLDF